MRPILKSIFILLSFSTLNATLVSTAFVQNDLKLLEELDIKSSYITNYKLQKELRKRLRAGQKKGYAQKLNNADLFIPQIKKILRENNIPSAFLYLVMAESNFILDASSNKKAKGLWQFMPLTAKHFGLETNKYIDERMDIIKSTNAAVSYLKKLHKMFGKWYLAAIAYNCGEGRVVEGITRATIDMYCDDVGYKICRKDKKIKKFRDTIRLYHAKKAKYRDLNKIYNEVKKWKYKPDIDQLLIVQPNIRRQYIPTESRRYIRKIISLAIMNNSDFLAKDENIHLLNRGISEPLATIDIKGGILLSSVATLIGLDNKRLKDLNLHIKKNVLPSLDKIYRLYIPYSKLARYNLNKDQLISKKYIQYRVKSGDSLLKISKKFGIDYKFIKKYNQLKSNNIMVNQDLLIPTDPYAKEDDVYTVKMGDTLSKIANMYKIPLKKLIETNHLKTTVIKVGEKVKIKYD